ncbi:MAG: response regulator transcription factor [Chloroflexi bacterium]|nr:response regulator transcription factor [Chloroflexota bacterium]MDA8188622.1 response regulator transcription factor [Dehalococcoidales bacterium]
MSKILIVDDEPTLVETIKYNLQKEGHEIAVAFDGVQALEMFGQEHPDLIVLDVMLPKLDGFEVCRVLRKDANVPILMLTAKDEEIDKIVGLELGADDYMTKPFSMRELLARVKAMLRRVRMVQEETAKAVQGDVAQVLFVGEFEVDLAQHLIRRQGIALGLKPKEFDLLAFLIANRGQVFTREALLERVWGYSYSGDTRTVDVHVRGLREKIEEDPASPQHLETVRGVGYRFRG